MKQNELRPPVGAKHKPKRVGRGDSSGHGKTSGRGTKGQKARGTVRRGFEGGQLPLIKRMPRKRGFTNIFRVEYEVVNLSQLKAFPEGAEVNPEALLGAGLVRKGAPVKILGEGGLDRRLVVKANKFSASAKQKIEAAGGVAEETPYVPANAKTAI
ncbi:MAG: 50S ribosomal protein L15 [Chloroflexi bacterium]|nr:50S ribosomal protein L15 [Chloroflexota bacterium]